VLADNDPCGEAGIVAPTALLGDSPVGVEPVSHAKRMLLARLAPGHVLPRAWAASPLAQPIGNMRLLNVDSSCFAATGVQMFRHDPALHQLLKLVAPAAAVQWHLPLTALGNDFEHKDVASAQGLAATMAALVVQLDSAGAAARRTSMAAPMSAVRAQRKPGGGGPAFLDGQNCIGEFFDHVVVRGLCGGNDALLDELFGGEVCHNVSVDSRELLKSIAAASKASASQTGADVDPGAADARAALVRRVKELKGLPLVKKRTSQLQGVLSISHTRATIVESIAAEFGSEPIDGYAYEDDDLPLAGKFKMLATKCAHFSRLPRLLVVHFKRGVATRADDGSIVTSKNRKRVAAPRSFDATSLCESPAVCAETGAEYVLEAVALHDGASATSGHYTCLAIDSKDAAFVYDDAERPTVVQNVAEFLRSAAGDVTLAMFRLRPRATAAVNPSVAATPLRTPAPKGPTPTTPSPALTQASPSSPSATPTPTTGTGPASKPSTNNNSARTPPAAAGTPATQSPPPPTHIVAAPPRPTPAGKGLSVITVDTRLVDENNKLKERLRVLQADRETAQVQRDELQRQLDGAKAAHEKRLTRKLAEQQVFVNRKEDCQKIK
jgi:hypothetical protein